MDARELQKLWHELVETSLKNPNVEQFMRNLSFVISYLISEQDKRKELAEQIKDHAQAMNEAKEQRNLMNSKLDLLYQRSEKNGQLLRRILTAVVGGLIVWGVQIMLTHKP